MLLNGRVVELVDTRDLKSLGSDTVRVRFPSCPPKLWGVAREAHKEIVVECT